MSYSGDFSPWADCFPVELLPIVFGVVLEEWPKFTRPTSKRKLENRITHRFVAHLKQVVKGNYPFGIRFRPKLVNPDADNESGELDIEIFTGFDTDVYFAFECKRLFTTRTQSRASEYVGSGGMGCFVTGQYNGQACSGGMIGYVMKNHVSKGFAAVDKAIQDNKTALCLLPPLNLHKTDILPKKKNLHQTKHRVEQKEFIIYHMFLPV